MHFQCTFRINQKPECKMTKKLGNKSAGNANFNINSGCCITHFRLKTDGRFPQGKGWLWLSLVLHEDFYVDFCPFLTQRPCAVPSAEPGQLYWDCRDNWITEVTKSVIILVIIIIVIPAPHFPSLLKLLVCAQKQGSFSKGTKHTQVGGWVCLGSPPGAAAEWGRKEGRNYSHLSIRGACPDPSPDPAGPGSTSSPRRHSGLSSGELPVSPTPAPPGRVPNTGHTFQGKPWSVSCSVTTWEGSLHLKSGTTSNCVPWPLFC